MKQCVGRVSRLEATAEPEGLAAGYRKGHKGEAARWTGFPTCTPYKEASYAQRLREGEATAVTKSKEKSLAQPHKEMVLAY